jgi:hypothetical protein
VTHPYSSQSDKAFWKRAVAGRSYFDLEDLSPPLDLSLEDRFATAGSCFAQHIGRNLAKRGATFLDMEPRPDFVPEAKAREHGYGIFSARYGNIYTARQMLQLLREARGEWQPAEPIWEKGKRHFDALRPSVDPVGHAGPEDVLTMRKTHLEAVRRLFEKLDVLVFTLGLTEAWQAVSDDTVYPTAPGVIAGDHDPARYRLVNFTYPDIRADMEEIRALVREFNPSARMLLTVSPVPLMATATDDHVMVATTYSKSVLRAVAGDLAASHDDVMYFPSYEIISCHPGHGMFFEPDLRGVNPRGVAFVMEHFFRALAAEPMETPIEETEIVCDEERIETPRSRTT